MLFNRPRTTIACALMWSVGVGIGLYVHAPWLVHLAGAFFVTALVCVATLWGDLRRTGVILAVCMLGIWRGIYAVPIPVVPGIFTEHIAATRTALIAGAQRSLPEPHATLAAGMLLGDDAAPLNSAWRERFVRTGLLHLVAASGSNVALVLEAFGAVLLVAGISLRRRMAWMIAAIAGFVLLSGAAASIVRAGIMAGFALGGRMLGRRSRRDIALWFSAAVMVAQDPSIIESLGFQLSVLAVAALIYLLPHVEVLLRIEQIKSKILRAIVGEYLLASIVVMAALQPLLLATVGGVSFIAPVANLLVAPLVPLVMTLSALCVGAAQLAPVLGVVFGWLLYPPLELIVTIVKYLSDLQFAYARSLHIAGGVAVMIYVLIAVAAVYFSSRKRRHREEIVRAILRT